MENIYSSTSLNLFNEAIKYARTITEISYSNKSIIKDSTKTLFSHNHQPWEKKYWHPDFNVPMGFYVRAEIFELVGIFTLNKLINNINKKNIGFYSK